MTKVLNVLQMAADLGTEKGDRGFNWSPTQLDEVFGYVVEQQVGRGELLLLDGPAPGWLVVCAAHAAHPGDAEIKYPQGDCTVRCTGYLVEGAGKAQDLSFVVEDKGDYTSVEFSLDSPAIDLQATMENFVAPQVPQGKPVYISGRGPVAILSALANAYAHTVPYVACFQPGTGNVVAISHDKNTSLGEVK